MWPMQEPRLQRQEVQQAAVAYTFQAPESQMKIGATWVLCDVPEPGASQGLTAEVAVEHLLKGDMLGSL